MIAWLKRLWARRNEVAGTVVTRWVFLRALGFVYLSAFGSLAFQVKGLVGSAGITPAAPWLAGLRAELGRAALWKLPTLFLLGSSDRILAGSCWLGVFLSALLIVDVAPVVMLALLWVLYLSLVNVCGIFLGYQWDVLLLEVGFLAIFYAPFQILPGNSYRSPPSKAVLWLLRWCLFRLMFSSGVVKLASGDPTWWHLTALEFHYETQPLPPWTAWYAHQLPAWFQRLSCAVMFFIELVLPFFIFLTRPFRFIACGGLVFLQVLIIATGNFCFFNYLTIALCILLLDDAVWPERWRRAARGGEDVACRYSLPPEMIMGQAGGLAELRRPAGTGPGATGGAGGGQMVLGQTVVPLMSDADEEAFWIKRRRWAGWFMIPFIILMGTLSTMEFVGRFGIWGIWPDALLGLHRTLEPFHLCSSYGLFAVMTTERPEIVIEGSRDGETWLPYEFAHKAGDPSVRPTFVAPGQPRLDWQMWFAAMGGYRDSPWLINFALRLLQGSPDVLALLARNPFEGRPPKFIRAVLYDYRFTTPTAGRATGAWWRREYKGIYFPPLALR